MPDSCGRHKFTNFGYVYGITAFSEFIENVLNKQYLLTIAILLNYANMTMLPVTDNGNIRLPFDGVLIVELLHRLSLLVHRHNSPKMNSTVSAKLLDIMRVG